MKQWKGCRTIPFGISMFGMKYASKEPVTGRLNTQDLDKNHKFYF